MRIPFDAVTATARPLVCASRGDVEAPTIAREVRLRTLRAPTLLLTGNPSAGKTTLAAAVGASLAARGVAAEVLDGDELRARLPPPLGFTADNRSHQFARAIFLAELLSSHGVVPILALVAPFAADRRLARKRFAPAGWCEVFLDPPADVLLDRDTHGVYSELAACGGRALVDAEILDVYEAPEDPTLRLDTSRLTLDEAVTIVLEAVVAVEEATSLVACVNREMSAARPSP